jgi:hypothetical protein
MDSKNLLAQWVKHLFNHPVAEEAWYWDLGSETFEAPPRQIAELITESFERSGELLSNFSDEQLNQGFWFLIGSSEYMLMLTQKSIPIEARRRALRSVAALFEQVMAKRCSPHLSHLNERSANPLNSACYMWWDVLPIHGRPDDPERREFDAEALLVLQRILDIPHDACRESALHGIGHWANYYPECADIVDEWLSRTSGLRSELITYAKNARVGHVQ